MNLPLMKTRACLALAEESEAARKVLYDLLDRFPADVLAVGNTETEDNVRGILVHVTGAIFSYACWIDRVLGRLDPEVEKELKKAFFARVRTLKTSQEYRAVSEEASIALYAAMAATTEEELGLGFKTNWGEMMGVEMMMEHALVHLLRHRRQLEIHLGDRPAGVTAPPA